MDALLVTPRSCLPAIPGGSCGDARFGLWLMAAASSGPSSAPADDGGLGGTEGLEHPEGFVEVTRVGLRVA